MKDKNYIKDDGKIRNCYANASKMNLWELMYCRLFVWNWDIQVFNKLFKAIEDMGYGFLSLMNLIVTLLYIVLFPISFPLTSLLFLKNIKKNRKDD